MFSQFFGNRDPFDLFGAATAGAGAHGNPFSFQSGGTGFSGFGPGGMGGMFFGAGNPESMDYMSSGAAGFGSHRRQNRQDPPVEHQMNLSLDELFRGGTKKMKISRKVLSPDGTTSTQDKVVTIDIKPGWKAGTRITFTQEGDQSIGKIPADIIFIVKEKPHPYFTRNGNDLKYVAKISLRDALCGGCINILTIEGNTISYALSGIVNPNTKCTIPGEGMPISKHPGKRGNMDVHFDIQFPLNLPPASKELLFNALPAL